MPVAPPIPRGSGTSLHRQIFLVLRDEIARGVYTATGALPREEDLCERFGVSRITVRRALTDLASLGLIDRRHGLGTFVAAAANDSPIGPSLTLIDSLRKTASETSVQVLEVSRVLPPAEVATLLQLKPGERAVHALRLRLVDDCPVMLTDAWVPMDLGKGVTVSALQRRALYEILMSKGVVFGRVIQEISARVADPIRARLLQIGVGSPILSLVRVMHDPSERPVQHLTAHLAPERSRILMDIPGATVNTLSAGQIVHDVGGVAGMRTDKRR